MALATVMATLAHAKGTSEGAQRGRVVWYEQTEDYQNAITWASMQPEVDASRIGLWGSSFGGAHVLHVGASRPFPRRPC